jgi:hypothetical protein
MVQSFAAEKRLTGMFRKGRNESAPLFRFITAQLVSLLDAVLRKMSNMRQTGNTKDDLPTYEGKITAN